MSVSPLVSICIPTYNGERFIKETLASVVNQTHRNIEILVSDHSSSDSTRQIVESFRDERIRLSVLAPGGGAAANWNASVGSAKGQFVKLVCQDDILRPDCVDLQTKSLLQNPSASFSFSLRNIISPKGRTLIRSRGFSPDNNVVSLREGLDTLVRSGTNIFGEPCAVLMRKEALFSAGDFRGSYLIDLNMWLKLWEVGDAVFVGDALSGFRISKGSWTMALRDEQSAQISLLFEELQTKHPQIISSDSLMIGMKKSKSLQFQRHVLTRIVEFLRL